MRVTTLGPLALDGRPVPGERLVRVIRVLVAAAGATVPASTLVDSVWADDPPRDATGALQALVSRVRRLGLPVEGSAGGYRLPGVGLSVDTQELATHLAAGAGALHAGSPEARQHLDAARALLPRAPDLTDPALRAALSQVATLRAQAALAFSSVGTDDEWDLHRLATAAPPDEPAAALLMRLLAARGRPAQALSLAETLRVDLREGFGADPSPEVAQTHVALLRGELRPPALPAGWRRAATALVGRDADLLAATAALAQVPLVTLVGPGGAGKTRLAAEIARKLHDAGQPVRVVELAGVRGPEGVAGAVVAALAPHETATGVVVLDNCEHVLEPAAAAAARLLATEPGVTLLATSRAPLGLPGELVHRLRPLTDVDAVALLTDRARAGGATLALPRAQVLALCRRLDNLPLALELAAARLRHMPIDDLLAGLGFLDDALRGLPERHGSLWSVVDWSHALLTPAQRELWWRLAVVPAPFTTDLAVTLGGQSTVDDLATLVEHSLLTLGPGDDGAPRYRMLETVREYGEARLDAAGLRSAALTDLATWAAGTAVALGPLLVGPAQLPALARGSADSENLAAGLSQALATGDEATAIDIAAMLFHIWMIQGRHHDVVEWSGPLLRLDDPIGRRTSTIAHGSLGSPAALPHADRLAWTLTLIGVNALAPGTGVRPRRIAATCRRALRTLFAERADLVSPRTAALAWLASPTAADDPESDLATAQGLVAHDDPLVQGFGLFLRSLAWDNLGRVTESLADNLAAYQRFEIVGDQWTMGMAAQAIAGRLAAANRPGADEWLRRSAAHLTVVGAREDAASVRVQLDTQLALAGDAQAVRRLEESTADEEPFTATYAHVGLAETALRSDRRAEALAHIEAVARSAGMPGWANAQAVVVCHAAAAVLRLAADGDTAFAAGQLRLAREPAVGGGDLPAIGVWALAGAELAAHTGAIEVSRELWTLAVRLGARLVYPFQEAHRSRLADVLDDSEALLRPWRTRPNAAAAARARDLMAQLLG